VVKNPPRFGFTGFRTKLAGATPFLIASMAADTSVMKTLLAHGADPTLATTDGITPLMVAAGIGRVQGESSITESSAIEAVTLTMALGGDVNSVDASGNTALHGVAYLGWNRLLQFLVENGANVNVVNKRGETPLVIAEGLGERLSNAIHVHKDTADLLRQLGADEKLGAPNQTNPR
jgi:ankyrin repeat protein